LLLGLLIAAPIAGATARFYSGGGAAGVAWNWGGFEIKGEPGIFLCPGNYDPKTDSYYQYPWATWFPELITDC